MIHEDKCESSFLVRVFFFYGSTSRELKISLRPSLKVVKLAQLNEKGYYMSICWHWHRSIFTRHIYYNIQVSWRGWAEKGLHPLAWQQRDTDVEICKELPELHMYKQRPVDMQPALICVFMCVRRLPCCLCGPLTCLCLQQVSSPLNKQKML